MLSGNRASIKLADGPGGFVTAVALCFAVAPQTAARTPMRPIGRRRANLLLQVPYVVGPRQSTARILQLPPKSNSERVFVQCDALDAAGLPAHEYR